MPVALISAAAISDALSRDTLGILVGNAGAMGIVPGDIADAAATLVGNVRAMGTVPEDVIALVGNTRAIGAVPEDVAAAAAAAATTAAGVKDDTPVDMAKIWSRNCCDAGEGGGGRGGGRGCEICVP